MVALTSPAGTRVEVDEPLAVTLAAQGWKRDKVEQKSTARRSSK